MIFLNCTVVSFDFKHRRSFCGGSAIFVYACVVVWPAGGGDIQWCRLRVYL